MSISTNGACEFGKRQDCNPLLINVRLDESNQEDYIQYNEYDYQGIDMEELTLLARDFKALGHPARLAILDALRDGEQCVCHLESALGMRQAYISQQLAVLKEAGLVQDRRDGWNIYYQVIRQDVFPLIEMAGALTSRPGKTFDRIRHTRARKTDCPCPKCSPENEGDQRSTPAPSSPKVATKATG
jgi:DNA-binding transcriptional ArsR family regulator